MDKLIIDDLKRKLAVASEERDNLPKGLIDRWPTEDEEREIERLETRISHLESKIFETEVIQPRVELASITALLQRIDKVNKLFANKPKVETEQFDYLLGAAEHYLKEKKVVASTEQLWMFMKSKDKYTYEPKSKGFSGVGRAIMTRENFRKNLIRYQYKGCK